MEEDDLLVFAIHYGKHRTPQEENHLMEGKYGLSRYLLAPFALSSELDSVRASWREEKCAAVVTGQELVSDDDPDSSTPGGEHYVNRKVMKRFGRRWYTGTVASYNDPYWHIQFDDGDSEDFNLMIQKTKTEIFSFFRGSG